MAGNLALDRRPLVSAPLDNSESVVRLRKVVQQPKKSSAARIAVVAVLMIMVTVIAYVALSNRVIALSFERHSIERQIDMVAQDLEEVRFTIAKNRANIAELVKPYGLKYAKDYLIVDLTKLGK